MSASRADVAGDGDIVVTVRKREERVQDISGAIFRVQRRAAAATDGISRDEPCVWHRYILSMKHIGSQ